MLCFSNCLSLSVVRKILEGGADKCMEAGAIIAGGHSIEDEEVKYGLSVMGLCHPDKIRRNDTPRHGDCRSDKPLGTRVTAAKADLLEPESVHLMVETMARLNKNACANFLDGCIRVNRHYRFVDGTCVGWPKHDDTTLVFEVKGFLSFHRRWKWQRTASSRRSVPQPLFHRGSRYFRGRCASRISDLMFDLKHRRPPRHTREDIEPYRARAHSARSLEVGRVCLRRLPIRSSDRSSGRPYFTPN